MKRVLRYVGLVLCLAVPVLSGTAPTLSSTMTSKIQLTYFNIEGVAEKVRLAFKIGGIEFEDKRINFTEWTAIKPTTPFGQLPIMHVDGCDPIAQSGAMLRMAGKLSKLYPDDAMQAVKVDEIVGLQEDLSAKIGVTIYVGMRPETYGYPTDMPQEEKSALQKKLRDPMCAADGDLCKMLKMVEDKLAKTGTGYFVGDKPTIADCAFLPVCRQLRSGRMDFIPTDILDKYPKIVEFEAKMMALPAVKSHYA